MRVGNFCLIIPEGHEKDSGHVSLSHGQQFTIQLRNYWNDRACDAEISVDGKDEGGFRVDPNGSIMLQRAQHDTGRFTFFRSASAEAQAAGIALVENDQRGLIVVRFKPEHARREIKTMNMARGFNTTKGGAGGQSMRSHGGFDPNTFVDGGRDPLYAGEQKTSAGITGLTGHSNQQFTTVANLNYDPTEEVTITIRLVCDDAVRPLMRVSSKANPIPAPVE